MDKPTSALLETTIPIYRMQTGMFDNALAEIKDEDALKRIENRTNHIIWMAGNLVNCRYWLASVLGMDTKDPYGELFGDAKALDESFHYPTLAQLKTEWHKVSPILYERLLTVSEGELSLPYELGFHVDYFPEIKLNMISMALDRQSYLFGQIGLMRRILNYPGVKYDTNEELNY